MLSHRIFVWPTLILTGLITLFAFVEFSNLADSAGVRSILNDPLLPLARQAEVLSLELPADVGTPQEGERARQAVEELRGLFARIRDVLKNNLDEAREHAGDQAVFDAAEQAVGDLRGILLSSEEGAADTYRVALEQSRQTAHALMVRLTDAQTREARALLDRIDKNEDLRAVLAVLILIAGFVFVVLLLNALQQARIHADRARLAERMNALFGAALQSTRVGVLIRDMRKNGNPVVFVNQAFTAMTGYEVTDLSGESSDLLFGWSTDPAHRAAFYNAVSKKVGATINLLIYRKNGSPFWSEWHLSPVWDGNGELTHYVSLFTDTSAVRLAQDELVVAKQTADRASAVKGNFLAMMSHEIRTPINGILGLLKLVSETPLNAQARHLLDLAIASSRSLHGIINDILDYAKIEAGKATLVEEPFLLRDLVSDVMELVKPLADEKGLVLDVDVHPPLPEAFIGDAGRLRQILLNLVTNAIKFTETGGVTIHAFSLMELPREEGKAHLARFEVVDTGIGINNDDIGKLFKEFSQIDRSFTRRFGGTGLGLAICKRLVELLGGELGVESQPGKGSKFWFMLPLAVTNPSAVVKLEKEAAAPTVPTLLSSRTVLLVEDNETNRVVAGRYLEKAGATFDEAKNGLEAVRFANEKKYDIILMDVSMPEMDGLLATSKIRESSGPNALTPIIALTAHGITGDRDLCLAAGMNDYLTKPIDYSSLVAAMDRWLRMPQADTAPMVSHVFATTSRLAKVADFDAVTLERLRNDLGLDAVQKMIDVFLLDSVPKVEALVSAPLSDVREMAHALKSSSAHCGLSRFSCLMAELEASARRGDEGTVQHLKGEVVAAYAAGTGQLRQARERM